MLSKMFSRKWLFTTLLVFAGTAVCIRLGIWQLDRLAHRRAFNSQVQSMRAAEPLDLNQEIPSAIESMEWRAVTVTGEYDFENQVALRNRYHEGQFGYDLITPLLFDGGAVLVDRGWIPAVGNSLPSDWSQYDKPGQVTVTGQLRLGQDKPVIGGVGDPEFTSTRPHLDFWNNLNVARIDEQISYELLPAFIQPDPEQGHAEPPIPTQPVLELTEGSHLGYAFQWFSFAAILFCGYPFYLRKQP